MARRAIVILLLAAVAGLAAMEALASPRGDQYGNPARSERAPVLVSTTPAPTASASDSGLPFTGVELGLVVAAGCVAAGTGLVLRRAARRPRP